jgi:hypothetical protein
VEPKICESEVPCRVEPRQALSLGLLMLVVELCDSYYEAVRAAQLHQLSLLGGLSIGDARPLVSTVPVRLYDV